MKSRLRKRKKIRGGRAVLRCIADPTDGITYWQGPDGVFQPLTRTCRVYLDEVEEAVKRTIGTFMGIQRDALEHALNPIPPQGICCTLEFVPSRIKLLHMNFYQVYDIDSDGRPTP